MANLSRELRRSLRVRCPNCGRGRSSPDPAVGVVRPTVGNRASHGTGRELARMEAPAADMDRLARAPGRLVADAGNGTLMSGRILEAEITSRCLEPRRRWSGWLSMVGIVAIRVRRMPIRSIPVSLTAFLLGGISGGSLLSMEFASSLSNVTA